MPIGSDTHAWRRDLPHLEKAGKTHFVTFTTKNRGLLSPGDRDVILAVILHRHAVDYCLECAVVMPDHVHLVLALYGNVTLVRALHRIKSVSAHQIGRGVVWQKEYFDRIVRAREDLRQKCEYVCANPVRAGLVATVGDYPWVWRLWVEGLKFAGEAAGAPQKH